MSPETQTLMAAAVVAAAVAWLSWRWFANRKKPGCGGACGCPSDELKKGIRSREAAARMRS